MDYRIAGIPAVCVNTDDTKQAASDRVTATAG